MQQLIFKSPSRQALLLFGLLYVMYLIQLSFTQWKHSWLD